MVAPTLTVLGRAVGRAGAPPRRDLLYRPVPGIPVFRNVPRDPNVTEAPRGPAERLMPLPLKFSLRPGANLNERRNRMAIAMSLPNSGATPKARLQWASGGRPRN